VADSSDRSTALPWAGLAALLVGGYVFWAIQPTLQSSRPELETLPPQREISKNSVPARLWQDPLVPAQRDYESRKSNAALDVTSSAISEAEKARLRKLAILNTVQGEQNAFVQQRIRERSTTPSGPDQEPPRTLLLPVFLDSQPYSESTETRIRCRYAVLSALSEGGFVPQESDHIRYQVGSSDDKGIDFIVPFEWFVKGPAFPLKQPIVPCDYSEVMVLWVPEGRCGDRPLESLKNILDSIVDPPPPPTGVKNLPFPPHHVRILGPTGSTLLPEFLTQGDALKLDPRDPWIVYSDRATISDSALSRRLKDGPRKKPDPGHRPVLLERTIGTDEELAREILHELGLRGASPREKKNHAVLVAEWDDDYGRAWEESFLEALQDSDAANRVSFFTYLRGLDGRKPGEKKPRPQPPADGGEKKPEGGATDGPEGTGQFDYVRRLVLRIQDLQKDLKARSDGDVRAIGIVGSDVYDKILLLRALRSSFPNVVFFTSDLDARLGHPTEIEWTRNLIVASHFGLQLSNEYQGRIPPFRDSYQTSTFFACRRILDTGNPGRLPTTTADPRIYEIAQDGPFDLTRRFAGLLHPPSHRHETRCQAAGELFLPHVVAGLAIVLVILYYRPSFGKNPSQKRLRYGALGVGFVIYAILVACMVVDTARDDGKPLLLFSGISAWPSVILRTGALFVTSWFLLTASSKLRDNSEQIEIGLPGLAGSAPEPAPMGVTPAGRWDRVTAWARGISISFWNTRNKYLEQSRKIDVLGLWQSYQDRSTRQGVLVRCGVLVVLFVGLWLTLLFLDDWPAQPARGDLNRTVIYGVLYAAVVGLALLLSFTIDATRLCIRLIQQLSDYSVDWPEESLRKVRGSNDVCPTSATELLNIRLIALRTESVEKLIYPPFIVVCILLFAQSRLFDDWRWNIPLWGTFGVMALSALYCGILVRYWAERARRAALIDVREELIFENSREGGHGDLVKSILEEIESTKRGAFSPMQENPILHSVLIPFGGIGSLEMIRMIVPH
jgi:hypothetical protein